MSSASKRVHSNSQTVCGTFGKTYIFSIWVDDTRKRGGGEPLNPELDLGFRL